MRIEAYACYLTLQEIFGVENVIPQPKVNLFARICWKILMLRILFYLINTEESIMNRMELNTE